MASFELSTLDAFSEHRELLLRAAEHFETDPRVAALAVSGSLATGGVDFYSDVDLDIIARDADFDGLFADRDAAAEAVGNPLFRFIADHLPFGSHMYIVLYAGPVKVDFSYRRMSRIGPSWTLATRQILKDTDGFLADVIAKSQALTAPEPAIERIVALNQKFWTWCWYVYGKIVRGELWEALDGVNSIRGMAILPMLEWAAGWPGGGYRRLESKLAPDSAEALAATVASLDPASLYAALLAEVALFRELRGEVFARYGLRYDPGPEEVVGGAMERCTSGVHWSPGHVTQG